MLAKDLLAGSSVYTFCSSVSNQTMGLLSVYIGQSSVSEGSLFLKERV